MVEGTGMGISSTRVRKAANEKQWDEVGRLCTDGVTAWIREEGLYEEDARGKKMMG
jgi:nicotinamide-nucleotide adenylyltransferase